VGPDARSRVRAEATRLEDGRNQGVRAGHGVHGQQPHRVLPQAPSTRRWPRGGQAGLEVLDTLRRRCDISYGSYPPALFSFFSFFF